MILAAVMQSPPPIRVRMDDLGVVSTMIDGKGPYHFVLDTGAGICVLSPEFAKRAGFTGTGNDTATGVGKATPVQTLTLGEMRVGDAVVHDVPAAIIPLPLDFTYQGRYGTIDGIVGYTFLSHFATTIDIEGHAVTFTDPNAYVAPGGSTTVTADFAGRTPVVNADADGIAGRFQIDTGSNGWVDLTTSFVTANGFTARYPHGAPILTKGVGGDAHSTVVRLSRFSLAGTTIPHEVASLSQTTVGFLAGNGLDGNIGTEVLRHFTFTVDYAHNRVDFQPHGDAAAYRPYRSSGMLLTRRADGTFRVIAVTPGSAAARAGIVAENTVIAIDGQPAAQLDSSQISQALHRADVQVSVRSGTVTRELQLHLANIV